MSKRKVTSDELIEIKNLSEEIDPNRLSIIVKQYGNINDLTLKGANRLIVELKKEVKNPDKYKDVIKQDLITCLEKELESIDPKLLAGVKRQVYTKKKSRTYRNLLRSLISGKKICKKKERKKKTFASERAKFYYFYIRSVKWVLKKEEFRNSSYFNGYCFICGSRDNIDIHHDSYDSLGNEQLNHLLELCRPHHEELHRRVKSGVYKQIKGSATLMKEEFLKG